MMLIYAFYVIHSHELKKRVVRNLFTQTPSYPLVNALYNHLLYYHCIITCLEVNSDVR